MALLIIVLAIAAISIPTVRLVLADGRGPQRPPRSHFDDPHFRTPGRA